MNKSTAFVPNVALRSSSFTSSKLTNKYGGNDVRYCNEQKKQLKTVRTRRAIVNMNVENGGVGEGGGSLPNFDEIAQQLQAELQKRSVDKKDEKPMPSIEAPNEEQPFVVTTGHNDMSKIILKHIPSEQEIEIYTYGANITSWKSKNENHFWISKQNEWKEGGKAIRGGIPICFPQFGPYGNLIQHGFARITNWIIKDLFISNDKSITCILNLNSSMKENLEKYKLWPYKFNIDYTITISSLGLETKLSITNLENDKPIEFTCAFHNYFAVTSVKNSRIFGYENIPYLNRLKNDQLCQGDKDEGSGYIIENEIDRIYKSTPDELAMFDFGSMKVLKIKKTDTLPDATLWNPYGAKGSDPGWDNFICIEPANIVEPTVLQPGETWVGAQLLGVE